MYQDVVRVEAVRVVYLQIVYVFACRSKIFYRRHYSVYFHTAAGIVDRDIIAGRQVLGVHVLEYAIPVVFHADMVRRDDDFLFQSFFLTANDASVVDGVGAYSNCYLDKVLACLMPRHVLDRRVPAVIRLSAVRQDLYAFRVDQLVLAVVYDFSPFCDQPVVKRAYFFLLFHVYKLRA